MDQENNIPSDTASLVNIESPALPVNDPVDSALENFPSITVETDDVQMETDSVHTVNEKDLCCSNSPSNDNICFKEQKSKTILSAKSPNEKKNVSFADDKGQHLEAVQHFPKHGLPKVSKSAFADLKVSQNSSDQHSPKKEKIKSKFNHKHRHTFIPMFYPPGADLNFFRRVRQQNVCLESVQINGTIVKGVIRVSNLCFQKQVQVTFTTNNWKTKTDVYACLFSSHSSVTDRFEFIIRTPFMQVGAKLFFFIKYVVNGYQFWDNNYGFDYTLDCVTDCE